MTATSQPLLSLAAFRSLFSTTIPKSPWPVSLEIAPVFGRAGSQSCNRITCLMTSSADRREAMTRAMSRVRARSKDCIIPYISAS